MSHTDPAQVSFGAGQVFTPAAPIDAQALFAGRRTQLRAVLDAVSQRGQHAIIFGERGVGKTSLANILSPVLEAFGTDVIALRVNCDGTDNFESAWRKAFADVQISRSVPAAGFHSSPSTQTESMADQLPERITPDEVRRALVALSQVNGVLVVIDEFDRISGNGTSALFADTIKTLSDYAVNATIVIVGVADTVDELIAEHESVQRAMIQIQMPRMSREEANEIVEKGLSRLGLDIEPDALNQISTMAKGLPHYVHLLALHSTRRAADRHDNRITVGDVDAAISEALESAQQSIRNSYHRATQSPRTESLFRQVLLACALAPQDDLGYFAPADVRDPMTTIMGRAYDIPSFSRHLADFTTPARGSVLQTVGEQRRRRYRFANPLMQPFVVMRGVADGLIDKSRVR